MNDFLLMSDKIDFKKMNITRDRVSHHDKSVNTRERNEILLIYLYLKESAKIHKVKTDRIERRNRNTNNYS